MGSPLAGKRGRFGAWRLAGGALGTFETPGNPGLAEGRKPSTRVSRTSGLYAAARSHSGGRPACRLIRHMEGLLAVRRMASPPSPYPLSNHSNRPRRKRAASAWWGQPHGGLRLGCAKALGQNPAKSRELFSRLALCPRVLRSRRLVGGESGIRTHGTFRYTRFPSVRLKPTRPSLRAAEHNGVFRVADHRRSRTPARCWRRGRDSNPR